MVDRPALLGRIHSAWQRLEQSYAGLSDARLTEPGVAGDWSVKDILAHVTTWEEESLKYLPLIVEGGRPPKYARYGGIDAFNAMMTDQKRGLSLSDVRQQMHEIHARLIDYLQGVPEEQLIRETRFRRRLRLDTYRHYLEHARMIGEWRAKQPDA
jgi:selenocysteine lyase/cysteine desulfurase